jgi:uncharacterized membrane protein
MYSRIWEIDFFRGVAILLMVVFHLVVDLKDFYGFPLDYLQGFWYYEGKLSAIMFMLLAGISTCFGRNVLKHGLRVFGWGMVLTVITYIYYPHMYIRFGILHLLGSSLLLYYFIRKLPSKVMAVLSIVIIIVGNVFIRMDVDSPFLFPLGLTTANFMSMDHYPLLPWSGVFLLGVVTGRILYGTRQSLIVKPYKFETIEFLGRHSLLIYLIHQPIMIMILYLLHMLAIIL